jgi:hypothetical protein
MLVAGRTGWRDLIASVTGDGGSILLQQVDRRVDLIKEVAENLFDSCSQDR